MAILVDETTRLVVQGITGKEGQFHTLRNRAYGTNVVAGVMPGEICSPGPVGFISRSGTLTYQIVHELTQRDIGQSTCVGMGGDPVHGIGFLESLERFEADADTDLVVMIGEIGGDDEERAAR